MCEYCNSPLNPLYQISTNSNPTMKLFEPNFCPICGEPLTYPTPLTLEELKERDGKPVYIISLDENKNLKLQEGKWYIISGNIMTNNIMSYKIESVDTPFGFYAYDHPPKGSENNE